MSAAAWQESVNPVLLERLLRPLVAPGSYALIVRVKDAVGTFDTRRLVLRVKP